jgi:hypothetical protein
MTSVERNLEIKKLQATVNEERKKKNEEFQKKHYIITA